MFPRIILSLFIALLILPSALYAQNDAPTNPLTGLPISPENLDRRPLMVKISNHPPEVRPQYGLIGADIIWEHIIDDGHTRLSAIYLGDDMPLVGPVRALSPLDFDLTRIYQAIAIYSQGSPGMVEAVQNDPFMSRRAFGFGDTCPPFCRAPRETLDSLNNAFGDMTNLRQRALQLGLDTTPEPITGMVFNQSVPLNGVPTDEIEISYSGTKITWLYEEFDGNWLRSQDGQGHFDGLSGSQLNASNVVLLEASHTLQQPGEPFYWDRQDFNFTVQLVGTGRIYLFRDGQYFTGQWNRQTQDAPLNFLDQAGNPLAFKPGKTFINLLPSWRAGYQLAFLLADPPSATVTSQEADLFTGPGRFYNLRATAYEADMLQAIGRNQNGDWIQLKAGQEILWASNTDLSLNVDIFSLPVTRPATDG